MPGIHGIILAGGISSRMGFPKALMPIGDSFLLLSVYQKMMQANVKPVHMVINSGLRVSLEAQMAKFPDGKFVLNQAPAKGQIHSLQLGLESASADGADAVLVTPVDVPFVQPATMSAITFQGNSSLNKMIVPRFGGENGHPYYIPREKFDAFMRATEMKSARDIMHDNPGWVESLDVTDRKILVDVDTLEDLASAQDDDDSDDFD